MRGPPLIQAHRGRGRVPGSGGSRMPLPRYSIRQFGPRFVLYIVHPPPFHRPPSSYILDNPCSPMQRTRDRRFVDLVRNSTGRVRSITEFERIERGGK